jgi:hypothetical protein
MHRSTFTFIYLRLGAMTSRSSESEESCDDAIPRGLSMNPVVNSTGQPDEEQNKHSMSRQAPPPS